MEFSEEIRMLRDAVDEFGKKELMSAYRELEPKGEFPSELVKKISDMGLMGVSFPQEYGGMGMNTVATSVVGERLAFYWPSLQLIWSANVSLAGFPIMEFGAHEQKKLFLPRLARGEILGCYALTEPDAGSDAANIKTRAVWSEGPPAGWRIRGTKTFITNADSARVGIVFARVAGVNAAKRHGGITAFLLASDETGLATRGVSVRQIEKWGLRCSHFCEITLSDAYVFPGRVLGEVGNGFRVAMETLNNGRINIAAQSVGIARRALYEAEKYGSEREAFGKPIIKMKAQADRFRRLSQKVKEAWEFVLLASRTKDSGGEYIAESARAKLFSSETAVECALFNYRIHGGLGYTAECTAMSILHDALATITYEGTSDIQRLVIAKSKKEQ